MDISTIRLIRSRALKDIEGFIPEGFYRGADTLEKKLGRDLILGSNLFCRDDSDLPLLSPRQKVASTVLMKIDGMYQGPGSERSHVSEKTVTQFQKLIKRYLPHLEAIEARPIEMAMANIPVAIVKHQPKQLAQEQRLLALLNAAGYDAKNLPTRKPGVGGVKAQIRTLALEDKAEFFTIGTFNKAWQRLREDGALVGST